MACFWTDFVATIEICGEDPPLSDWVGLGNNGFIGVTTPNTIGNEGGAYSGYSTPAGFNNAPMTAHNLTVNIDQGSDFDTEFSSADPSTYSGTLTNLNILQLDPSDHSIIDTFPMAGSFSVASGGQPEGYFAYGYTADFTGTLPTFDPDFHWGFVADLDMTGDGDPVSVEVSGSYVFAVEELIYVDSFSPGTPVTMLPRGPVYDEDDFYIGLAYNGWFFPTCDTTTPVDFTLDGDPLVVPVEHTCT